MCCKIIYGMDGLWKERLVVRIVYYTPLELLSVKRLVYYLFYLLLTYVV